MQMLKKLIAILVVLASMAAFIACSGDETCNAHTDADKNGKCDTCGETVEVENGGESNNASDIALIKDGKINFQIVQSSTAGAGVMMTLNQLETTIASLGGDLEVVSDTADTVKDIEVLIGDVTSRGEKYTYDKYSLGMKGYIIKVVDGKIIINAGSLDTLVDAVEEFIKDILGIKSSTKTLSDVTMTSEDDVVKIQDDYRITSVKINGEEINGYTIAYDVNNMTHISAASALNKFLYEKAGYYLPLVPLSEAGRSIIIEAVDYAGNEGFRVTTDDNGALRIQCAYTNAFEKAWNTFLSELRIKTGDILFDSSYVYTDNVSVVYYEDFGAVSNDGLDDTAAIRAAHAYANECGQTVKAARGATYNIDSITTLNSAEIPIHDPVIIKTNVEWGNAKFIIDDRYIDPTSEESGNIFMVDGDYERISLSLEEDADIINSMFPGATIDCESFTEIENWPYDFPALIQLYNSEERHYIRYGYNTSGDWQTEVVEVDENGKIINDSELLFDYEKVTHVHIYRTDDKPITISGGEVTTKACQQVITSTVYVERGMMISRSHVTVDGVKHYVTDELDGINGNNGVSYSGFFVASHAADVKIQNCILTARKYYRIAGTYDFTASYVNGIYLINCKQSNYYILDENGNSTGVNSMHQNSYWGVGGTNYCKNMVYDGCELTRYDAHAGLYNGKIINSKVTAINLIGGGDMLIENCDIELTSTSVISLRQDYGATWNGNITVKDCRVSNVKGSALYMFNAPWVNHNFGYICHLPNATIDNLTLKNETDITVFTGVNTNSHTESNNNINVIAPPQFIKVINNRAKYTYRILGSNTIFSNTQIEGIETA